MEILQIEEYVKTKTINVLDLDFVKTKVFLSVTNYQSALNLYVFSSFKLFFQKPDDADAKDLKTPREQKKYVTAQTPLTMPGHTGYLTFATLPPSFAR